MWLAHHWATKGPEVEKPSMLQSRVVPALSFVKEAGLTDSQKKQVSRTLAHTSYKEKQMC